jgi:hypothetical protein
MSSCQTPQGELNIFDAFRACPLNGNPVFIYQVETISIMSTVFKPYLIAILALIWVFDIWHQGLLERNGSARQWRYYGAGVGVTYVLISKNQWILAFAFTIFALTWSRLPDAQSNAAGSLPSFDKFIKNIPDASQPGATEQPTTEGLPTDLTPSSPPTDDEPTCIVCWSSDILPKILPCTHLICPDCLTNLAAGTQNHCPMCRLPLFARSNATTIMTLRALASIWNADIAVRTLALALHIYNWEGWSRGFVFDALWVFWQSGYALWTRNLIVESGSAEWWRSPTFSRMDGERFWRRPLVGFGMMGFTLAAKMHEVLKLDEKVVFHKVE